MMRRHSGGISASRMLPASPKGSSGVFAARRRCCQGSAGIGTWSVDDIATLLKTGMTPSGDVVAAPMSEVVEAGTAKLTASDRRAIAVYLKSVPAQTGKGG